MRHLDAQNRNNFGFKNIILSRISNSNTLPQQYQNVQLIIYRLYFHQSDHAMGSFTLINSYFFTFQLKWCTLDHGHLKYFNDKQMVAVPKESIPLASIVCLRKHEGIGKKITE